MGDDDDRGEACAQCRHKYSKADSSPPPPAVTTFNKILFGGYDISKDLCLPRKISQAIPDLVPGDKYILQDTNGQRWEVTLGYKDDSDDHLAFREGWDKFYEDHGLKTGYILAFHYYTLNAPFVVEIFDRTGFEKINFPVANGKKRKTSEIDGNSNAIGECQNLPNQSSKSQGLAFSGTSDSEARTHSQLMSKDNPSSLENGNGKYQHVASANCDTEPHCMINRDDGSKYLEDRTPVLNLANSEMQFGVGPDGSADKGAYFSNTAAESDAVAGNISENPVSAKVVSGEPPAEVAVTLSKNKNITSEYVAEVADDYHGSNQVHSESRIKSSTRSLKRVRREPARSTRRSKRYPTKVNKRSDQIYGGEERDTEVHKVTKTELVSSFDGNSLDAPAFSFTAIVKSHELLELAASVTLWVDIEKKVVNLEGPNEKVWPVLYHNKRGIKALTSGWENFCMSNGLRKGDECAFRLVNEVKTIFRIDVKAK